MKYIIKFVLISIFLIIILTRIIGLFQPLFGDEYVWIHNAIDQKYLNYYSPHPPLAFWLQNIFYLLFGQTDIALRIGLILINVINISLGYFLIRKYYDKKQSIFYLLLIAVNAWFLAGSLQLDMDGSFLTLFFLLSTMCYLKYFYEKKNKYLFFTGILIGFGLLTKYSSVLLFIIFFVHYLLNANLNDTFKKRLIYSSKFIFILCIISFLIFMIFPILSFMFNSNSFMESINHGRDLTFKFANIHFLSLLIQLLNALLWIGPLIFGLFILYLFAKNDKKNVFFIWSAISLIFYVLINTDSYRPIERYLLITAIPLTILASDYLAKLNLNKKYLKTFIIFSIFFSIILFLLNCITAEIINFYPKVNFINALLQFKFSFLIPFEMSSGPLGFYINFASILFAFALCALFLIVYILLNFQKNKEIRQKAQIFLILFLALGTAYNFILMQEYLLSTSNPNINIITTKTIDYALNNKLKEPIYIFRNFALTYYLKDKGPYENIIYLDFKDEYDNKTITKIKAGGTVIVIDFPQINKKSELWQTLEKCTPIYEVRDKEIKLGYIFTC